MDFDFLQQDIWGVSVLSLVKFGGILLIAVLLKRYISSIFTKLFYTLFKKFSKDYYGQQFKKLLLHPIEGIIVTVLFFVAFYQISFLLDTWVILQRKKGGDAAAATIFTVMDFIEHLFFLSLLYFVVTLIVRIIDFFFLVLLQRAVDDNDKERQQILPLLKDVLRVVAWCFGILSVLGVVFHVNVAALIAGLGVGGIAIAFAAKDSLENLLASFMVMIDKPFTIGDWIKINGVEGNVEKVGFRSTRIRTFDKTIVSIANRKLIDNNLENFSDRGIRRVSFTVGAVYGLSVATLETTIAALQDTIINVPGTDGTPIVNLESFGDFSVDIRIIYFVKVAPDVNFIKVREAIYFRIYEVMYKHAKGFAYPTQMEISTEELNEVFIDKKQNNQKAED